MLKLLIVRQMFLLSGTGRSRDIRITAPVPTPCRALRGNAGAHSNPQHILRSACNTISLSPDVLSQLLTSMGVVFFRETVKAVKTVN